MVKKYRRLNIDEALYTELKREADRQGTSLRDMVGKALREYVLKHFEERVQGPKAK